MNNTEKVLVGMTLLAMGTVATVAVVQVKQLRKKILSQKTKEHILSSMDLMIGFVKEAVDLIPDGPEKDALVEKIYTDATFHNIKITNDQ